MKYYFWSIALIALLVITTVTVSDVSADTCNPSLLRAVEQGQKNGYVKNLQSCLIARGYTIRGGATGYYGPNTALAVKAFYKSELGISNWNGRSVGPRARSVLGGTTGSVVTAPSSASRATGLRKIASATQFQQYLNAPQLSVPGVGIGAVLNRMVTSESAGALLAAPVVGSAQDSAAGPSRVSGTNVQVAGIDEPDIVKTDGTTIYFSREQNQYWVQPLVRCAPGSECASFAPNPEGSQSGVTAITAFPLSSLGIASDSIRERGEMLLVKDQQILIIMSYNKIVAYDVSNPAKPVQKWTNELNNNTQIVTARLQGNTIYMVTSTYLGSGSTCPIVPMTRGTVSVSIPCGSIWAPDVIEPANTTYTVFTLDPATGSAKNTITYLGDSNTTTVSMFADNLYIAHRVHSSMGSVMLDFYTTQLNTLISSTAQSRIAQIVGYDISVNSKINEINQTIQGDIRSLSDSEQLRIQTEIQNRMTAYMNSRQRETDRTMISRIALPDLSIAATGSVPGHLLNQFSLDEHNGNLRVATTVGETWNGSSMNDVYVLDRTLKTVGSVTDLGITERIYSVRFIGDRAYVVTFRQIDPFYVIDLSVPTNPRVTGELKIPGYSAYLEPLSDDLVLGVGREGNQVKMSLFDVSNPAQPIEKSKYTLNESWTEVENNHHAFLRDPKHSVFFVPGGQGGYVLSYAGDTLALRATVAVDQVKRAVFIDDMLYIVAQNQVTVLDETTWKELTTLKLD